VSDESGSPQIYVFNMKDKSIRRLTYEGGYNTDPQWSPKGDQIIYVGRTEGKFQVFSIAEEGGLSTQLTYLGNNENPAWSPAGRLIIFSSDRTGEKSLYVMLPTGRKQRQLLKHKGGATMPNWGPNIF
jgi:TolB protein